MFKKNYVMTEKEAKTMANDLMRRYPEMAWEAYTSGKYAALEAILSFWRDQSIERSKGMMYPDSLHMTHTYRGLVALKTGNVGRAKNELMKSSMIPRSPTLGTFGPNMRLAKNLLENGEVEIVLTFLKSCRRFWFFPFRFMAGRTWAATIASGKVPDFKANLVYHTAYPKKKPGE